MKPTVRTLAVLVMATLWLPLVSQAADLRINLVGVRRADGQIMIAVYTSPEAFLNEDERTAGVILKAASQHGASFPDMAPGSYAVSVFHDENGNGELDKNVLGMPTEDYGFSNNARGFMGPPRFEAAAITLDTTDKVITITLK